MNPLHQARSDASSAGAALAAAREELNLSVADVARHLKLSPAQVEALEEGAYDRLPGRVFVRGFLRNYAKLLGVDAQPLLRRIEHEMPKPKVIEEPAAAPQAVMPTGERSRWPVYFGVAGTIIAALAAYEFGFNNPPSPAEVDSRPTGESRTAPDASDAANATAAAPAPSSDAAVAAAPASTATPVAASGKPIAPAVSAASADKPAVAPGEHELHLQFEVESWVEIRDANDKVIFSKLNRAGAEERVSGAPPFKLVVGNARGVRLTYDQKPVDLTPHIGVTVARLTLQ